MTYLGLLIIYKNFILMLATIYLLILTVLIGTLALIIISQIIKKKKLDEELIVLQEKSRTNSVNSTEYYSLGSIYLSKKLFDQAILNFRYALKTWDQNDSMGLAILYNTIGFTYFESKQYSLAIYYYKEAITKVPSYTIAINNLAHAYEKEQSIENALLTYKQVLLYDKHNKIANGKMELLRRRIKNRDDRI